MTPNTQYFYKLTVVNSDGESNFSNLAAATPVDVVPPVITHTVIASPRPANVAIPLAATVTDNAGVQSVKLFYRVTGASNYSELAMTASGNLYAATIPANQVAAPGVDYYLEARDLVSVAQSGQPNLPHQITIVDRPFIDNINPTSGPSAGGTQVTISGRNFKPNPVVRFAGAIAAITNANTTQIVCTTPPHAPAVVDVRVLNSDGGSDTRAGGFTYQTTATLTLPTTQGPRNVPVQIPLSASVQGLTSADLRINFDHNVIRPRANNAVRLGTLTGNWGLQFNTGINGQVRIALASQGGAVTGTGTLAVIEFDVLGNPESFTDLSFDSSVLLNGGAISYTVTNGRFTVAREYSISGTVRHWFNNVGLGNVLLALTGDRNYTATSAANGTYSLNNVVGGNYTLTPGKTDQTEGISALDASLIQQHAAGLITLAGAQFTAADVDRSGTVNSQDAFYVLQRVVELIGLPFPGAGAAWLFDPAQRDLPGLNQNQTQDFTGVLLGDVNGNFTQPNRPVNPATLATLALPEASVPVGAEFSLLLALNLPQGQVLGAELRITYNPAVVTALAVESGSLVSDWLRAVNLNTPGLIRVALAGSRSVTTSGDLLRLRMRATGAVGSTSLLNITQGQLNEGGSGTTLQAGRVTLRPRPVRADFDLDGKTDLSVWRGVTGEWLIARSGNSVLQAVFWGTSSDPYNDVIVPGDYDNDGKADVAVWRPSTGTWYIQRSSDGAAQITQWGAGAAPYYDVPVPGDYDGDGKADVAVWRQSTGTWYVIRSSNGSSLIQQHGQAGDTPVPARQQ